MLINKMFYKQKCFFSALTKNLNWEFYFRVELILKDMVEIKEDHFMGGPWEIKFLGGEQGVHKKQHLGWIA